MSNKLPRFLLGIDPSQDGTGYCVLDCRFKNPTIAEKGTVMGRTKTWGNTPNQIKLALTQAKIKELMAKYHPLYKLVFLERGFSKLNNATQATFRARGVIEAELVGYEIVELPPSTVKKEITGNGHADKGHVAQAVAEKLGIDVEDFETEDESDATAVAYVGYLRYYLKERE